ncbi:MAG: hypothetical protein MJY95_08010 [Bacteroidaceae bacterium]|nr:hypothetical protein [Bacteroidaceae bacterium]
MKKQKHNGMHSLLAVIALMLAVTIYASCSSDDDAWDSSSLGELGTMADGTLDRSGESGGTVYFVGEPVISGNYFDSRVEFMNNCYCDFSISWGHGFTGNTQKPRSYVSVNKSPCNEYEYIDTLFPNGLYYKHQYTVIDSWAEWTPNNCIKLTFRYHDIIFSQSPPITRIKVFNKTYSLEKLRCAIDSTLLD